MKKAFVRLPSRAQAATGMGLAVMLLAAGCLSQESLYREVRLSRARAYQRWRQERVRDKKSEAALKGSLTLEDAIKLALAYNKSLLAIVQEKLIARGRILESYSAALPKLSAVGGYTRLDEVSTFDVAGRSVSMGDPDNYSAGLEVRQPIFRGGATAAAIRAARMFSSLSNERVRGAVQDTIYAVAKAYYEMLLAQHLYAVSQDAVTSAESHLADVTRKRSRGVASEYDVLRAQVEVSNFKAEMLQQRNRIHLSKTRLLKAMGVSQESEVTLSDELTHEALEPVLEEAVRITHENRPDLHQAELALRLQQEALRAARSRYWPRADAFFSQEWARPDPHSSTRIRWDDAWRAGVTVEWPLFDGLSREGRIVQEKAALRQKNIQLLDAEERALLEIQQALLSLRDAEEFVESQRLNLERAREAERLAKVGYRQGVNTEVEVTDARAALTTARGLHYEAIYRHTIVRLDLQRAMGILGPRPGQTRVPAEAPARPAHIEEFAAPQGADDPRETNKRIPASQDHRGDKP